MRPGRPPEPPTCRRVKIHSPGAGPTQGRGRAGASSLRRWLLRLPGGSRQRRGTAMIPYHDLRGRRGRELHGGNHDWWWLQGSEARGGMFRGPACLREPRSRRRSSWPILAAKTHITQEKPHKHLRSGQCSCFLLSHVRLPVWPSQQLQAACKAASAWLMMRGSLATLLPTYWLQTLSSPPCQQHPASCSSPIVQDRAGSVHTQVRREKLKKSVLIRWRIQETCEPGRKSDAGVQRRCWVWMVRLGVRFIRR